MKKKIFVICIAFVILSCAIFTSCNNNTTLYNVYEIKGEPTENSSLGIHVYHFSSTISDYKDMQNSSQKVTIQVGSLDLEGVYQSTEMYEPYGTTVKQYSGTDQYGRDVEFSIDDATGKLSRLRYALFTETDRLHTQEECQEIAQNFLAAIVGDRTDYVLYDTKIREIPEYGGALFEFSFSKAFGELLSDETVEIFVSAYGVIEYYMAYYLYEDNNTYEPVFDKQAANEAIEQHIDAIYENETTSTYTYKIKKTRISKFNDGNNYLRYEIEVQTDGNNSIGSCEVLDLAVRIP